MAIKKVKKQKPPSTPRQKAEGPRKYPCVTCGTERTRSEFGYEIVNLLDSALYACDETCYRPFQAAQKKAMPPRL